MRLPNNSLRLYHYYYYNYYCCSRVTDFFYILYIKYTCVMSYTRVGHGFVTAFDRLRWRCVFCCILLFFALYNILYYGRIYTPGRGKCREIKNNNKINPNPHAFTFHLWTCARLSATACTYSCACLYGNAFVVDSSPCPTFLPPHPPCLQIAELDLLL